MFSGHGFVSSGLSVLWFSFVKCFFVPIDMIVSMCSVDTVSFRQVCVFFGFHSSSVSLKIALCMNVP